MAEKMKVFIPLFGKEFVRIERDEVIGWRGKFCSTKESSGTTRKRFDGNGTCAMLRRSSWSVAVLVFVLSAMFAVQARGRGAKLDRGEGTLEAQSEHVDKYVGMGKQENEKVGENGPYSKDYLVEKSKAGLHTLFLLNLVESPSIPLGIGDVYGLLRIGVACREQTEGLQAPH